MRGRTPATCRLLLPDLSGLRSEGRCDAEGRAGNHATGAGLAGESEVDREETTLRSIESSQLGCRGDGELRELFDSQDQPQIRAKASSYAKWLGLLLVDEKGEGIGLAIARELVLMLAGIDSATCV